eukprot:2778346-Rhodomonas_salina.2
MRMEGRISSATRKRAWRECSITLSCHCTGEKDIGSERGRERDRIEGAAEKEGEGGGREI